MSENIIYAVNDSNIPIMDENGNIKKNTGIHKVHLENAYDVRLTYSYYYINQIDNNNFVVGDFITEQEGSYNKEFYDESKVRFRYGVIELQKDAYGSVNRMQEKTIVPIVYEGLLNGNNSTLIGIANGKSTYIEFDKDSENYGRQLVPAILDYAEPFDTEFFGFAKCGLNGKAFYISRSFNPSEELTEEDLLTRDDVLYMINNNDMYKHFFRDKDVKIKKKTRIDKNVH